MTTQVHMRTRITLEKVNPKAYLCIQVYAGYYNWANELLVNVKKMSKCENLDNEVIENSISSCYSDLVMNKIMQAVQEKKELQTYGLFKTVFKPERYLVLKHPSLQNECS